MSINRTNYEIWFNDWADNNLPDSGIEELNRFLDMNPDLLDEFNAIASMKLLPDSSSGLPDKDKLKRPAEDLSPLQFELLCAAYHEDDLTPTQKEETELLIEADPDRKKTFELLAICRLTPRNLVYKHKNHLRKRSVKGRIVRMTLAGLSVAASTAILILLLLQRQVLNINSPVAGTLNTNNIEIKASVPIRPSRNYSESDVLPYQKKSNTGKTEKPVLTDDDLSVQINRPDEININKINLSTVSLTTIMPLPVLAKSEIEFREPLIDDGRSNFEKFVAKTFRKNLLDEKSPADSPIKGYEIAQVGVTGINKLFGWDMALTRNTDKYGDTRSVKFSSKLVKFNAPVKKSEPSE